MDKITKIKRIAIVGKAPEPNPEVFSEPVQEILAAKSPEDLQQALEKHQGIAVTSQEVMAVKKHGYSVIVGQCYGSECGTAEPVTKEEIRAAMTRCAERHANVMDDIFEEVPDEPIEDVGAAEAPAEGE